MNCIIYNAYNARLAPNGGGGGGKGSISRQRRCVWCINCADGCASTVLAHYHKAGANNLIGETFSTQETGVIEIWEV